MDKNVAILIIFFNKLSQTIECIESFLPSKQKIYILNNASEENSWRKLQLKFKNIPSVFFFNSEENLGPARGRNLLIGKTTEDWIFLVDNDIRIKQKNNWKEIFDQEISIKPEASIFCPSLFNLHENAYSKPHEFVKVENKVTMQESANVITNYFPCCGAIVRKDIFKEYGLLDEKLFAFEDYEFAIRALCSSLGQLTVYPLPQIELIHDHQFQKNAIDKKTIRERYDENKIKESMDRVMAKHDIVFDHDWEWWTKKQINDMTKNPFMKKMKGHLKKALGR